MKEVKELLTIFLLFTLAVSMGMGYILLAVHFVKSGNFIIGWGMLGIFMLGVLLCATFSIYINKHT